MKRICGQCSHFRLTDARRCKGICAFYGTNLNAENAGNCSFYEGAVMQNDEERLKKVEE